MIKVYNKQSKYLRVSGKIIAPFKTEDFEERNQQIRILERNGIVVVTDVLSENTTPIQSNIIENDNNGENSVVLITEQPEISEETSNEAETEVEVKEDNLSDEKIEEPIEESEEPKTEETEKVQEKKAKRAKKSKKGGNK